VLALAGISYALLQSLVAPALPSIQRYLHTSTTAVTWVFTAFLVSASVATPIVGRIGDIFGKERTLVAVLGVLAAGTLVSALASSVGVLIVGRVIQGSGGANLPAGVRNHPRRVPTAARGVRNRVHLRGCSA